MRVVNHNSSLVIKSFSENIYYKSYYHSDNDFVISYPFYYSGETLKAVYIRYIKTIYQL